MKDVQFHNATKKSKETSQNTKTGVLNISKSTITKKRSVTEKNIEPKAGAIVLMPKKLATANDFLKDVQLPEDW